MGSGNVLNEDKVLRINCPGFGISSILPLGEAKPLAMYEVIVVNPTSILHLFESNSDVIKQIEVLQSDGMTSYRYETDSPLENIQAEVDIRSGELSAFLKKGGLLIVFLAPPFTVSGPSISMDNYSWLGDWCPDKPSGPNQRNMSATIRGKTIETSTDAAQSVWVPYLKQAGLEWSTIIRFDNLTEGLVPLATAGLNKIIAGFKSSGPKAGQVVFLSAPYGPEYDAKLKECIDRWYALHSDESAPPAGLQDLSKGLSSLLALEEESEESEAAEAAPAAAEAKEEPSVVSPTEAEPAAAPTVAEPVAAEPAPKSAPKSAPEPVAEVAAEPAPKAVEPAEHNNGKGQAEEKKAPAEPPQFFDKNESETTAEPDQLIKKMQKNLPVTEVPEWCAKFSFEELDGLRRQHENVEEQIKLAQIKAKELEDRIARMEAIKNSLLSADGVGLAEACTKVFERLGWVVKEAIGSDGELWLVDEEKTQSIVRLHYCTAQPNRSELAALAESVITYWGAHEIEPKGILVSSSFADKPPQERPDEEFPDSMHDFAKRKNLCLLTACQLLAIYRDLEISQVDAKKIRENILTTSGRVPEYQFNKKGTTAAKR